MCSSIRGCLLVGAGGQRFGDGICISPQVEKVAVEPVCLKMSVLSVGKTACGSDALWWVFRSWGTSVSITSLK
jgi:hypothetical protein